MRLIHPALPAVLVSALVAGLPAQVSHGVYRNDLLGFTIKVPAKWDQIPLKVDEHWIAAKFLSNKAYPTKGSGWAFDHKPFMKIVVFTEDAKKIKVPKAEALESGSIFISTGAVPYQSYQDYLKRNMSGFFFNEEEEQTVAGIPCMQYEVKLHKSEYIKTRLITWVFKRDDMDVAVEFEVLEDRYDKLARLCRNSLKTFRFVEPEQPVLVDTSLVKDVGKKLSSELWTKFRDEWRELPVTERHQRRKTIETNRMEEVKARSTAGWDISRSEHFLVVSSTDSKYAKQVTQAAEAFRSWCNDQFGDLSDEYVRHGVLRICKNFDEYGAYSFKGSRETSAFSWDDDREVVTYQDTYHGTSGRDMGIVFSQILGSYINDKDPLLYRYLPAWLDWGLRRYVANAHAKGRKIEFKASDWEREEIRESVRADKIYDLKTLMTLDDDRYWKMYKQDTNLDSQLAQLVRYLMGPGNRQKLTKNFLTRYMEAVIEVGEELRKAEKKGSGATAEAETEQEEEAQAKARQKRWKEERGVIFEKLNSKMCDWNDKQWSSLQKSYERFIK